MLTHFSLFTGIGGIDLAAEWAGFESVGQCEWADYQTKVLEKHWPDVPRWRDIRDVTAESFNQRTGLDTVTLVSGGFPCQPFSVAGKQRGKEDDRYLWPEMLRVISELRPSWVVGENVAGFASMVQFTETLKVDGEGNTIGEVGELFNRTGRFIADEVLESLEEIGYEVQAFNIPACGVQALHERKRIFIVAHSGQQSEGSGSCRPCYKQQHSYEKKLWSAQGDGFADSGKDVADANSKRWQGERSTWQKRWGFITRDNEANRGEWEPEPDVGRVAHGIPCRVDRLKCLGNAVVPQQVYPILKAIAEIERGARPCVNGQQKSGNT
jgi:DNA (cytosine-5)-methyltransferase 1